MKFWKTRRDGIRQRYSKKQLQAKYKKLVKKRFIGENPRITDKYARFRQANPKSFSEFRTKKISDDKSLILGRRPGKNKWEVQSIMIKIKEGD
jgi:hypothetical protein